jgi:hypothetical protein
MHSYFGHKPEEKRPTHRREDNIKIDFKEIGCEDRKWINLPQGRIQW